MTPYKRMSDRTSELQRAVIDEYRRVPPVDVVEHELWLDLLKTSRALANNGAESSGTQSRRDFIAKFHICLKESKECLRRDHRHPRHKSQDSESERAGRSQKAPFLVLRSSSLVPYGRHLNIHPDTAPFSLPETYDTQHAARKVAEHN